MVRVKVRVKDWVLFGIAGVVGISVAGGVIGCAASSTRFAPYTETAYEPSDAVVVLHGMPTDRTYVALGEVSVPVRASNRETHVIELRNRARQVGADAIVLLGHRYTGAVVSRGTTVPQREAVAVAIRY